MTDANIAQTGSVLVAIKISKARHEILIAVPGKKCPKERFSPTWLALLRRFSVERATTPFWLTTH